MVKERTPTAHRSQRSRRATQTSAHPTIHCYVRRDNGVHGASLEEAVREFHLIRNDPAGPPRVWIDIECPGVDQERLLRDELGLHQLAVEDCMRGRQRPKLDMYPGYLFLVTYAASLNVERHRTALEELHVFTGERWIVTVHDNRMQIVSDVAARWRAGTNFTSTGALAHALLDGVVDSYLPVIDHLGVHVDEIEHQILTDVTDDRMAELLELRHEVATTRRLLSPLHDIIRNLVRRDAAVLDEALHPYFQDVLDHVKRETEELDALRDTLAATLDAYLSISANKLNQTLRIMAAWSIILMAMAWLAGIYGMNFDFMPELQWRYGYVWALLLMLFTGGGLILFFRKRGWL
jgi:magnesium transporter